MDIGCTFSRTISSLLALCLSTFHISYKWHNTLMLLHSQNPSIPHALVCGFPWLSASHLSSFVYSTKGSMRHCTMDSIGHELPFIILLYLFLSRSLFFQHALIAHPAISTVSQNLSVSSQSLKLSLLNSVSGRLLMLLQLCRHPQPWFAGRSPLPSWTRC